MSLQSPTSGHVAAFPLPSEVEEQIREEGNGEGPFGEAKFTVVLESDSRGSMRVPGALIESDSRGIWVPLESDSRCL